MMLSFTFYGLSVVQIDTKRSFEDFPFASRFSNLKTNISHFFHLNIYLTNSALVEWIVSNFPATKRLANSKELRDRPRSDIKNFTECVT